MSSLNGALGEGETRLVALSEPDPPPPPVLSINDVTHSEGDAGTKSFDFLVSMSGANTSGVSVTYATADGSATRANHDYVYKSGTLNWPAGDTSPKTISVTVNADTTYEPDETFYVKLSGPNGAIIVKDQGVGTILNDDPLPSLSISDVPLAEGNSGTKTFSFIVSMTGSNSSPVSVRFTAADGTATADNDYVARSGTLTWAGGDTSAKTISVTVNGDTDYESDERFYVDLSGETGANVSRGRGIGTIVNDDPDLEPPRGVLTGSDITVGGAATYTFSVTYTDNVAVKASNLDGSDIIVNGPGGWNAPAAFVSVDNNTNGTPRTATYRIDAPGGTWDAADNGTYNVSLLYHQVCDVNGNYAPGDVVGVFHVSVAESVLPQATLLEASDVTTDGPVPHTFTVRYTDNLAVDVSSINKSNLKVMSSGGRELEVTSASPDNLMDGTPRIVTYGVAAPGGSWDRADNGLYTISLRSTQVSDTSGNFAAPRVLGNFAVNLPPPKLVINDVRIKEGDRGTKNVTFMVSMTGANLFGVSVKYATADGAATTADRDYLAANGTLNWAPGDTAAKRIRVTVKSDISYEFDEVFRVILSAPTHATLGDDTGTCTILNDDKPPAVTIHDRALLALYARPALGAALLGPVSGPSLSPTGTDSDHAIDGLLWPPGT